ncbi:branched-chain amino acid ABC transporter permease [Nocardioides sp.]|uniref:branched-chain amino acid ABC transporter permease n=1 Tax=Nocardioides sp. TaxID=35761 RepID=UPI00261E152D|nr:branched-chain amino acid ABC transporter permease [Nocardioides sp.]MDI6911887.1 branched-chain amino acid ABC transporter permease [Nocardioides sp.]
MVLDTFLISGLFHVVMLIGLALLLHLQLGLSRIANFGVVGFWGVGLYAFGVLYVRVDWPFGDPIQFVVCAALATVAAGLCGLLVGWLIADLDVDGVMVGTLGFATAVALLATTEQDLTGGALGMGGLRFPYDTGDVAVNELIWLLVLVALVAGILAYVWLVHRNPYGRLLIAIGSNEPLAKSLGKPATRTKLGLFTVTSALMGLLGAMYGVMVRFLEVSSLGIELTLAAVVGLVVGGSVRVLGAVVGVLLTVGVFDIVIQSYIPLPADWYTQTIPLLREVMFGLALILVLVFRPLGLLGHMRRDRLMKRIHGA